MDQIMEEARLCQEKLEELKMAAVQVMSAIPGSKADRTCIMLTSSSRSTITVILEFDWDHQNCIS